MHGLSNDSFVDLVEMAQDSYDTSLEKYGPYNYETPSLPFKYFREETERIAGLTAETLDVFFSKKAGAPCKWRESCLASLTAELFRKKQIHLSSYEDGQFMSVLRELFREIFPESGDDAVRRPGNRAIQILKNHPR